MWHVPTLSPITRPAQDRLSAFPLIPVSGHFLCRPRPRTARVKQRPRVPPTCVRARSSEALRFHARRETRDGYRVGAFLGELPRVRFPTAETANGRSTDNNTRHPPKLETGVASRSTGARGSSPHRRTPGRKSAPINPSTAPLPVAILQQHRIPPSIWDAANALSDLRFDKLGEPSNV